jgi:hypothetical protein
LFTPAISNTLIVLGRGTLLRVTMDQTIRSFSISDVNDNIVLANRLYAPGSVASFVFSSVGEFSCYDDVNGAVFFVSVVA